MYISLKISGCQANPSASLDQMNAQDAVTEIMGALNDEFSDDSSINESGKFILLVFFQYSYYY